MVVKFYRTADVLALIGLKRQAFYAAVERGDFPPPDTYLGERSPVWTETTIAEWQRNILDKGKAAIAAARSMNEAAA